METYFAPAERADKDKISAEISFVSTNPLMSELLNSISGLLAILDEHRQIVAMNESFLRLIGIDDPAESLGMRPGEVLDCVHAQEEPGGCGTAFSCATCGAAIAIMSSLEHDGPAEQVCALKAKRKGSTVDMALIVRAQPIKIEGKKFLLLFLQDITRQQQQASLERSFFHDIGNLMQMLIGASELLADESDSEAVETVKQIALRLNGEMAIQRSLSQDKTGLYRPFWYQYEIGHIFDEAKNALESHPQAFGKQIAFSDDYLSETIRTDISLMLRIITNMGINALEATPKGGTVRVWAEKDKDSVSFCVWNSEAIPERVRVRIFQRNFSTKGQIGRGIGTYSMKLFGEDILGGRVIFTTSEEDGTVFRFTIPV